MKGTPAVAVGKESMLCDCTDDHALSDEQLQQLGSWSHTTICGRLGKEIKYRRSFSLLSIRNMTLKYVIDRDELDHQCESWAKGDRVLLRLSVADELLEGYVLPQTFCCFEAATWEVHIKNCIIGGSPCKCVGFGRSSRSWWTRWATPTEPKLCQWPPLQ